MPEIRYTFRGDASQINRAISQLKRGFKDVEVSSGSAFRKAKQSASGFQSSIFGINKGLAKFGLGVGGLATVGLVLKRLTSNALEFEKQFANVTTLFEASKSQVAEIRSELLGLGGNLGDSVDLTRALYDAISAGIEPGKAVKFVGEAARFAKASVISAKEGVDLLTTSLNSYGAGSEDAARFSEVLFKTIRRGKTTGAELAQQFGQVTSTAAVLGVSFEELGAATAALTAGGIKTQQAITSLRTLLASVAKPSSEAAEAADLLGLEFNAASIQSKGLAKFIDELTDATKDDTDAQVRLFGSVEAFNAIASLTSEQGAKRFTEALEDMKRQTDLVSEGFDKQTSTVSGQLDAAWNNLNNQFTQFGAQTSGPVVDALKSVNEALEDGPNLVNTLVLGLTGKPGLIAKEWGVVPPALDSVGTSAQNARGWVDDLANALTGKPGLIIKRWREVGDAIAEVGESAATATSKTAAGTTLQGPFAASLAGMGLPDLPSDILKKLEQGKEGKPKKTLAELAAIEAAAAAASKKAEELAAQLQKISEGRGRGQFDFSMFAPPLPTDQPDIEGQARSFLARMNEPETLPGVDTLRQNFVLPWVTVNEELTSAFLQVEQTGGLFLANWEQLANQSIDVAGMFAGGVGEAFVGLGRAIAGDGKGALRHLIQFGGMLLTQLGTAMIGQGIAEVMLGSSPMTPRPDWVAHGGLLIAQGAAFAIAGGVVSAIGGGGGGGGGSSSGVSGGGGGNNAFAPAGPAPIDIDSITQNQVNTESTLTDALDGVAVQLSRLQSFQAKTVVGMASRQSPTLIKGRAAGEIPPTG